MQFLGKQKHWHYIDIRQFWDKNILEHNLLLQYSWENMQNGFWCDFLENMFCLPVIPLCLKFYSVEAVSYSKGVD